MLNLLKLHPNLRGLVLSFFYFKHNIITADVFTSVVLVTFSSAVQYDNWLKKFRTFYNKKAIEFLRENGQISQRAPRVLGDDVIRVTIIWTYRDYGAYEKCQKFHGQWGKVGGKFIAKTSGYRGYQVWSDLDVIPQE